MTARVSLSRLSLAAIALGSCSLAIASVDAHPVREPETLPWFDAGPLQPIVAASGETDPAVRGAWKSRGYGYILLIDEAGVARFQDGVQCYALPREDGGQSAMDSVEYRYFRMLRGEEAAIFQLLDGDTNVVFDRLDALPENCTRTPDTSPQAVAAEFLDAFETHYQFFDRRMPGHVARAARLDALIQPNMTDAQLWEALASYMDGLSDSHTKLIGTVDGERRRVQDGQGETLPMIRASAGGEGAWLGALIDQAKAKLGETARHEAQDRILWGVIDTPAGRRVGYLQVFVMGGFTTREDFASPEWAAAEMAELNRVLDEALAAFEGADAVIVDLSNNRGGWDRVAKALPGRFTDSEFTGFTTQARGSGQAPFPNAIAPADGPRFTGPLYVMTSDVTVSGGELATLAFRQLPNVTQVGGTTRGAFSTPLAKPLPNGWLLELSNETFADKYGAVFEETGIAPDIALDIYPADDPVAGHWRAVEQVAALAGQRKPD